MEDNVLLQLQNIHKTYQGIIALDNVSFSIQKGEIHSILGENGAGKSTLVKILSGNITPDAGKITFGNRNYSKLTPSLSQKLGIAVIYQEFHLIPHLSVSENIFLGKELRQGVFLAEKEMKQRSLVLLNSLGLNIDPDIKVSNLSSGEQKMVEILKALAQNVKILILDEPTASISGNEVKSLRRLMDLLKKSGVTLIYISQRIEEVFGISDRVTVIRDGRYILTKGIENASRKELKGLMSGRYADEQFLKRTFQTGNVFFKIENLGNDKIHNINIDLKKGEIIGFAGLTDAGKTELARAVFGADTITEGRILLDGKEISVKSPYDAIRNGIGLLTQDTKKHGLLLNMCIEGNCSLTNSDNLSECNVLCEVLENNVTQEHITNLKLDASKLAQFSKFSNGNKQKKLAVAEWLTANARVLIFDDPSKEMATSMKFEFYALMCELTRQGLAIILFSSDVNELIGMSDRIFILQKGNIKGVFHKDEITEEEIIELVSGISTQRRV